MWKALSGSKYYHWNDWTSNDPIDCNNSTGHNCTAGVLSQDSHRYSGIIGVSSIYKYDEREGEYILNILLIVPLHWNIIITEILFKLNVALSDKQNPRYFTTAIQWGDQTSLTIQSILYPVEHRPHRFCPWKSAILVKQLWHYSRIPVCYKDGFSNIYVFGICGFLHFFPSSFSGNVFYNKFLDFVNAAIRQVRFGDLLWNC